MPLLITKKTRKYNIQKNSFVSLLVLAMVNSPRLEPTQFCISILSRHSGQPCNSIVKVPSDSEVSDMLNVVGRKMDKSCKML